MKRLLAGSFMAAAFAVGLSAQTTPPQSPTPQTQPPARESRDASANNVTVTGCLKAGDSADSFMLTDLKWSSKDKSTGAVGTTGTAGAPPAALATATALKVIPSSSAKLSEHVGHQVEVTGTIADKDKASTSPAAPATPTDPAGARPSASSSGTPALDVRSVKMISASCSQ